MQFHQTSYIVCGSKLTTCQDELSRPWEKTDDLPKQNMKQSAELVYQRLVLGVKPKTFEPGSSILFFVPLTVLPH